MSFIFDYIVSELVVVDHLDCDLRKNDFLEEWVFYVLRNGEYLIFWFYFYSIEDEDSSGSSSEDESGSDNLSSESEDKGTTFCFGAKVNPGKLNVVKANDCYEIVYDGDGRVFIQTRKFCRDIQT